MVTAPANVQHHVDDSRTGALLRWYHNILSHAFISFEENIKIQAIAMMHKENNLVLGERVFDVLLTLKYPRESNLEIVLERLLLCLLL